VSRRSWYAKDPIIQICIQSDAISEYYCFLNEGLCGIIIIKEAQIMSHLLPFEIQS
jgi:hypothetical protein